MRLLASLALLAACVPPELPADAVDGSSLAAARRALGHAGLVSDSYVGRIRLKLVEGVRLRDADTLDANVDLSPLAAALDGRDVRRLYAEDDPDALDAEDRALRAAGVPVASRSLFLVVDEPDRDAAERLVEALTAVPVVELAWFAPTLRVPAASTTPSYRGTQGWHDTSGIRTASAWALPGGRGEGVRVADCEHAWDDLHEDLPAVALVRAPWFGATSDDDHGTAVLGVLGAVEDGHGMDGGVPGAELGFASWDDGNSATAIRSAASWAGFGGVVLLEGQTAGPAGTGACDDTSSDGCVPTTWDPADHNEVVVATAAGVVVVAAAGNGGNDLDDPVYGGAFDPVNHDSGAIVVGAGDATRQRLGFSNSGSIVDVQGWGSDVGTTGYGSLADLGLDRTYTATFSGTSSATPIVSSALASLQGIARAHGVTLPHRVLEALVVDTGRPQPAASAASGPIGPLPDLSAAVPALTVLLADHELDLVAPTVLRRGRTLTATVSGAHAGDRVYLGVGGTVGEGPCPVTAGGLCFEVPGMTLLGRAVADGTGVAKVRFTVPSTWPTNAYRFLQAGVVRGTGGVDSVKSGVVRGWVW